MPGITTSTSAFAVAGAVCLSALGQEYVPVEPAVGDTSILSTSLRVMEPGLQAPSGFSQVYRVPGGQLMRGDGALFAVFPESNYVQFRGMDIPVIPAGTVFYIGGLPENPLESQFGVPLDSIDQPTLDAYFGRVSYKIDPADGSVSFESPRRNVGSRMFVLAPPRARHARPTLRRRDDGSDAEGPAIVTDSDYRARRMRDLLQTAVDARRTSLDRPDAIERTDDPVVDDDDDDRRGGAETPTVDQAAVGSSSRSSK